MAGYDTLKNLFTRDKGGKESKYLNADGTPKTVIATAGISLKGIESFQRNENLLNTYWKYYQGEGTIFAAINTIAWNTVMVGYHLTSENGEAKKLIQTKFDEMDIDGILHDNVRYALVFGDAFIEKVMKKNNSKVNTGLDAYIDPIVLRMKDIKKKDSNKWEYPIINKNYKDRLDQLNFLQKEKELPKGYISYLKTVSPITMIANQDKYGNIESYQQKIQGVPSKTILAKEEIIQLNFFPQLDSPYGISMIGPSKNTIERKIGVDEALYNAIIRHGTSKFVITVGTKDEIPPKALFDKIKTDLEDISSKNEFIVPGPISMDTIDEKGVPGVEEYASTFQEQLIVGLMCPEESLGLGKGGTEATSKVKEIMFERFIKSIQHKLATKLRVELINQILIENGFEENIVHMKFNSVTDADEASKAKWIGNLLRGFPEGKKPITINEVRAAFDYPDIDGGDELIVGDVRTPPESSAEE